jgi:hypothetical protein
LAATLAPHALTRRAVRKLVEGFRIADGNEPATIAALLGHVDATMLFKN